MRVSTRDMVEGSESDISRSLGHMLRTTGSQNPNRDASGVNMHTMSELFLTNKPLLPDTDNVLDNVNALLDGVLGSLTGLMDSSFLNIVPRDILARLTGDDVDTERHFGQQLGSKSPADGGLTDEGTYGGRNARSAGELIIKAAEQYLGIPYVWGGKTPTGLDCSGLTWIAFHDIGVTIAHGSANQANEGISIPSMADAMPGDMLFWNRPNVNHIGFYAGNGVFLHAPQTGDVVKYDESYLPNNRAPSSIRRVQIPDSILREHGVYDGSSQLENEAV